MTSDSVHNLPACNLCEIYEKEKCAYTCCVLQAATNDDLNMLINLLESPILKSIATLHDSVGMLATQVAHHPSILPGDFDITPAGEYIKCLWIRDFSKGECSMNYGLHINL